jgi:hypothetical protein
MKGSGSLTKERVVKKRSSSKQEFREACIACGANYAIDWMSEYDGNVDDVERRLAWLGNNFKSLPKSLRRAFKGPLCVQLFGRKEPDLKFILIGFNEGIQIMLADCRVLIESGLAK